MNWYVWVCVDPFDEICKAQNEIPATHNGKRLLCKRNTIKVRGSPHTFIHPTYIRISYLWFFITRQF